MSSSGGGSRGSGAAAAGIPAGARKMVQSLKEIVNLPDQEIYVTLKECSMDPSEAVQRLLSQDSFHEVKSKRDKKKEMKEPADSRSRTTNNASVRGIRGGSDDGPRSSSIQCASNGFGGSRGKTVQKKEDAVLSVLSSLNMGSSSYANRRSTVISEPSSTEYILGVTGIADGGSLHSQSSSGYQHGCTGMPGHFSMADIVKMGRPQSKLRGTSIVAGNASHVSHNLLTSDMTKQDAKYYANPVLPSELDPDDHSSKGSHQDFEVISHEPETVWNKHISHDCWPPGTSSTILDTSGAATCYVDMSKPALVVNQIQLHHSLHEDETPDSEQNAMSEISEEHSVRPESISEEEIQEDGSEVDVVSGEVSLAATNLQNLSLERNVLTPTLEDNPAVIIPRHLQVTNADCSHLSFGSFGSGLGTSFPGSISKPLHSNSQVISVSDNVLSLDHSNSRKSNFYDNGELKPQINEDAVSRGGMNKINYEISLASEPEVIRDDANSTRELPHFPSLSVYGTSTSTQPSATSFDVSQTTLQMQNLTSLSSLMPYTSSLPTSLLVPSLQPLRDLDLPFSSLLATQSMSTKHTAANSISGPTISMQEVKPNVFSNLQTSPQSSASTGIPTGHSIPQQLPMHPYSQATLPLGPFSNMISYSFLPQSYTYLPSAAFPQAYTGNGPFHQSPAEVHNAALKYTLQQYKNSIPVTSLPQPAAVASGYGNYSGSTSIPGNFTLNPTTISPSTALGFGEALSSQYKEGTHYLSLQNESSPMWVHGGSSRTASPLPPNTFYGFQGQNQLNSFRQAQQQSHYGQADYLNFYQNQLGGQSQGHQQNPGEADQNGSQGNPSQQSHQIWQHGY